MGGKDGDKEKKKRKSDAGDEGKKKRKSSGGVAGGSGGGGEGGGGAGGHKVTMRVCKEAEGTTGSIVTCFANAPPPFDLMKKGGIELVHRTEASAEGGGRRRVLEGDTETLVFEGSDGNGGVAQYRYLIGLHDPAKKETVIADPGMSRVGNVVQLLRHVKSMGGGSLGEMTREQARDALVDVFGSKRVKNVHRKRKGQELEKEAEESIGALTDALKVKKEEAIAAGGFAEVAEGPSDLAPKCNVGAEHPSAVYLVDSVVRQEEWDSVQPGQILEMAKDAGGKVAQALPSFIRKQLQALLAEGDKKEKRKQAKLLMYAAFLILFHGLPSRFQATKLSLHEELGLPHEVASRFLSDYAEPSERGFAKPQTCKDRLILALCVTCLLFCRYEADFELLAQDLKLHPDKLSTYFREVGCVVTRPKSKLDTTFKAKLTAPPTFPKRSKGPMKAR